VPVGGASLKVELRPVKAKPPSEGTAASTGSMLASPPPRFAHSAAVLQQEGEVHIVVFGGVSSAALPSHKLALAQACCFSGCGCRHRVQDGKT
jgi:hypothetical protein